MFWRTHGMVKGYKSWCFVVWGPGFPDDEIGTVGTWAERWKLCPRQQVQICVATEFYFYFLMILLHFILFFSKQTTTFFHRFSRLVLIHVEAHHQIVAAVPGEFTTMAGKLTREASPNCWQLVLWVIERSGVPYFSFIHLFYTKIVVESRNVDIEFNKSMAVLKNSAPACHVCHFLHPGHQGRLGGPGAGERHRHSGVKSATPWASPKNWKAKEGWKEPKAQLLQAATKTR